MWGQVEQMLTAWTLYPEDQAIPFAVILTVSSLGFYLVPIHFFPAYPPAPCPFYDLQYHASKF